VIQGQIAAMYQYGYIHRILKYKTQIPNYKQIPMTKIPNSKLMFWSLDIVIWDLFVIWCLLFVIFNNLQRQKKCIKSVPIEI